MIISTKTLDQLIFLGYQTFRYVYEYSLRLQYFTKILFPNEGDSRLEIIKNGSDWRRN